MNTRWRVGALAIVVLCALSVVRAQGQQTPPRSLIFGHDVRLELMGGTSAAGELLGVTADSLRILVKARGPQTLALDRITELKIARHSFGWGKVWTWTAIGALVTGAGLTAACTSVEDAECGAVFPAVALSWGLAGGLYGAIIDAKRWQLTAPSPDAIRPYSRYPQGVPDTSRKQ